MVRSIFGAYANAYRRLPREIWLLSIALFINRCGTMVLPFLTIYLHEKLGVPQGNAAQMLSVYGLGALVGVYLAGWLTDRVGAVRLMILLLCLSAPVFCAIPWIQSLEGLAVALFVLAVFSEGVRPVNATAVSQLTAPQDQTRAFGLQRMALNLGISFGPAIGGFLAEHSFTWLFLADGATTFACAIMLLWSFGWKKDAKPVFAESETVTKPVNGSPLRDSSFLWFLGFLLVTSVVFFQFHATYPLYLKEHFKMSKAEIGLVFAVNTVVIVIFEMLLVDYARRWNLLRAIGWGCFLSCLGFGVLPYSHWVIWCVLGMLITTVGEMLSMPLASGWVGLRSAGRNRGMYMAWYSLTYSLASVVAPLIGGWCYATSPHLIWHIGMAIGVFSLVGYYWLSQRIKSEETDNAEADNVQHEAG